jgi:glutathione S-transferase
MKLYIMPGACSLAAHIALNWVGASFEVVVLSPEQTSGEEYRRINPKGVVPALVLDDGAVITEALAVLAYVADAYPGAGLGADPSDVMERTRLNEALADLVTNIHDAWSPVYVPDRFTTAKQAEDGVRQAAFGQLDKQYTRLDHLMADREWMVLGRRTVADAYLYVMCSWKDRSPTPLANYPALAAFKDRLATDEGVRRAVSDEPAE